jgi:predicted RNase H-like nuclease (RuvC/YqgF family)
MVAQPKSDDEIGRLLDRIRSQDNELDANAAEIAQLRYTIDLLRPVLSEKVREIKALDATIEELKKKLMSEATYCSKYSFDIGKLKRKTKRQQAFIDSLRKKLHEIYAKARAGGVDLT